MWLRSSVRRQPWLILYFLTWCSFTNLDYDLRLVDYSSLWPGFYNGLFHITVHAATVVSDRGQCFRPRQLGLYRRPDVPQSVCNRMKLTHIRTHMVCAVFLVLMNDIWKLILWSKKIWNNVVKSDHKTTNDTSVNFSTILGFVYLKKNQWIIFI